MKISTFVSSISFSNDAVSDLNAPTRVSNEVGNFFLAAARYLLQGLKVNSITHAKAEPNLIDPSITGAQKNLFKTIGAILLLVPGILFGAPIKAVALLASSGLRDRYNLLEDNTDRLKLVKNSLDAKEKIDQSVKEISEAIAGITLKSKLTDVTKFIATSRWEQVPHRNGNPLFQALKKSLFIDTDPSNNQSKMETLKNQLDNQIKNYKLLLEANRERKKSDGDISPVQKIAKMSCEEINEIKKNTTENELSFLENKFGKNEINALLVKEKNSLRKEHRNANAEVDEAALTRYAEWSVVDKFNKALETRDYTDEINCKDNVELSQAIEEIEKYITLIESEDEFIEKLMLNSKEVYLFNGRHHIFANNPQNIERAFFNVTRAPMHVKRPFWSGSEKISGVAMDMPKKQGG